MNKQMVEYEDALFRAAIYEAEKEKSKAYMEEMAALEDKKPSELERKRFEKLLDKEQRKNRRIGVWKATREIASGVAIIIMVVVTVSFTITMSAEALRARFIRFLMTFTPEYTEIQLQGYDEKGAAIESGGRIGLNGKYAPTYIPHEFSISSLTMDTMGTSIVYENNNGDIITFDAFDYNAVSQIDTENVDSIEAISVGDDPGLLVKKDGLITLAWSKNDYYMILLSRVSEQEMMKIAESVELQK